MSGVKTCMICGVDEFSHHEFAEREKGCVCGDWSGADEYPPICKALDVDKFGRCSRCEHEQACHAQQQEDTRTLPMFPGTVSK